MAGSHLKALTGVLVFPLAAGMFLAQAQPVDAQRAGQIVGAGAAGLALGVIIGSMANQGQAQGQPQSQGPAPTRKYRSNSATQSGGGGSSGEARLSKKEVESIQESLNRLGYDAGTVDGAFGQQTVKAIGKFQAENSFPSTGRLLAAERKVLMTAVENKELMAAAERKASLGSGSDQRTVDSARSFDPLPPDPKLEISHWETVRQSKIPEEIEDYIARYPNGQFRRLAELRLDLLKKEALDQPKKDGAPPAAESVASVQDGLPPVGDASYPKARQRRADAVAVIIGNSTYGGEVPKVDFSLRDAEAMRLLVMKSLGIDSQNVIFIKDATRAAMEKAFGSEREHKGELWRRIDPDGTSDVFVFYSGHGVPSLDEKQGNLLLPVDADTKQASFNGYPLAQLYKNLGELKTRSTTVFLDACFSGQASDAGASPLIKNASPVFISKATPSDATRINVFAAASERQLASWDANAGHGLFTRYVLNGLSGDADEDKNKEVTAKELADYVNRNVRRAARRMHGRDQDPKFTGKADFVIANY